MLPCFYVQVLNLISLMTIIGIGHTNDKTSVLAHRVARISSLIFLSGTKVACSRHPRSRAKRPQLALRPAVTLNGVLYE